MKELKWRADMTIEEKIDAGFKEVLRQIGSQSQEMNEFRRFMNQKLVEINGRFDKTDARVDARFSQLEMAVMMVSRQVRRVEDNVVTTNENVSVIKMDVKDLHERLDGLSTTVDRHDSAIDNLQKAVGQK